MFNDIKDMVIRNTCDNNACEEPSKVHIGSGMRELTEKQIKRGLSRHVDIYTCDKSGSCPYRKNQ